MPYENSAWCVPYARLLDFFDVLGVGELGKGADARVKAWLLAVLQEMADACMRHAAETALLSGDRRIGFDACHMQNRKSFAGYGSFITHHLGLVLNMETITKKSHEKEVPPASIT